MAKYNIIRGGIHHEFMLCRTKVQVFAGGFGNGKTAAACVKAIQLCMDYPGCNGLIARETYPKLNDTIRKEFYKWVPRDAVARWPTKDDNTLIFKNGSTINFRYIMQRGKQSVDGNTTSNLLSATYDFVIVDQMEDPGIQHKDFLDLLGRLRGSTPYKGTDPTMPMTGPRWMMLMANPTANWFYKKIIKPFHQYKATGLVTDDLLHNPQTLEPLITVIEGSTYENKHNLEADFIEGLEASYKGQMKDRFLMGKWAAYEGLVYPDYSPDTHSIPKKHMLAMLERAINEKSPYENFECFDFGIVNPSAFLFGFTDYVGRVFILDGIYRAHLTLDQIGQKILELRDRYGDGMTFDNPIWADPAIFKRTMTNGSGSGVDTVQRILTDRFDFYIKAGQNDIMSGITKVTEYLIPRNGMHYLSDKPVGPMIYFNEELGWIEDEFQAYFWKSSSEGDRLDEPRGKDDHALDALKYGVSRLPEASELHFRRPIITPEYLRWHEEN